MYCPNCGTENPDQAKFCKGCGQPLQTPATATGVPRWAWWAAGVGVVLIVLGGGLFLNGLRPSSTLESIEPRSSATTTSDPTALTETSTTASEAAQGTLPTSTSTPDPSLTPTATPLLPTSTPNASPTPDPYQECAMVAHQDLQIGDQVYVCTQSDRLTLRETPQHDGDERLKMAPGTALAIVDGPVCADQWLWWQVQTDEGDVGWVAESGDTIDPFFICETQPCETVTGPFADAWASVQQDIGCKTGEAFQGFVAEEHFEGGIMFWREDFDHARSPVLYNNGAWRYYTHTPWVEGSPDFSCVDQNTPAQCPPTPKRGFGLMWCDIPEIRNRLGNAVDCERGYYATMQTFTNGFMLLNDQGVLYILFDDGTWQQR